MVEEADTDSLLRTEKEIYLERISLVKSAAVNLPLQQYTPSIQHEDPFLSQLSIRRSPQPPLQTPYPNSEGQTPTVHLRILS